MSEWLNNITLEGDLVKLIPLTKAHKNDLLEAAADGELWNLWYTSVPSENNIDDHIDFALAENEQGRAHAFVVVDKKNNRIIVSSRIKNRAICFIGGPGKAC